jgi:predicted dienelactone hydrolase
VALALIALACEEEREEARRTAAATPSAAATATPMATPIPAELSNADFAAPGPFRVGVIRMGFVDPSRPIMPSGTFPGTPDRKLDTIIWYPADTADEKVVQDVPVLTRAGPFPLLISSHGLSGPPDSQSYLNVHLASHGYVVAAPTFPLTSLASFTGVAFELRDIGNQPGDVSFVIDRMLALNAGGRAEGEEAGTAPSFRGAISPDQIGALGLSAGAITTYVVTFGEGMRDTRIKASVLMAIGDPAGIAESDVLGFQGATFADVSVPALFFGASRDLLTPFDNGALPAFELTRRPKLLAKIIGGTHIWFSDATDMFLELGHPDLGACRLIGLDGCVDEGQDPLIDPQRQHELVKIGITAFFDAFLNDAEGALQFLQRTFQQQNAADLEIVYME